MGASVRHLALVVPDLQVAEVYYRSIFQMDLIGREAEQGDGLWYTLPFDKGWDDARAAAIELDMVALRKDEFVLALFVGDAPPGQVFALGLTVLPQEIATIRSRLPAEAEISRDEPDALEFLDRYEILWQISAPGDQFRTSGDFAGRWLEL
jgi:catechol 2,3-dioxygenase-like lactoylglutathione lyase family enzyme